MDTHHLLLVALETATIQALNRLHARSVQSRAGVAQFLADSRIKIAQSQVQSMSLGNQLAIAQLNDKLPEHQRLVLTAPITLKPIHISPQHKPDVLPLDLALSAAVFVAKDIMVAAYRESAIAIYAANDADGWVWRIRGTNPCKWCLSMEDTKHPLSEEFESHPNCIPAGAIVSGPKVLGSTTRWYNGEVIDIETTEGNFLTVTPNHPILTPDGWIAAGKLNEGSNIISRRFTQRPFAGISPNDYQVETPIEQVATSFGGSFAVYSSPMPTSPKDFHGDGIGSNVHIIRTYSHLRDNINSALFNPFPQQFFSIRNPQLFALACLRPLDLFIQRMLTTSNSLMSRISILTPLLRSQISILDSAGLTHGATLDTSIFKPLAYSPTINPISTSKRLFSLTRNITFNDLFNGKLNLLSHSPLGSTNSTTLFDTSKQPSLFQNSDQSRWRNMEPLTGIFSTFARDIKLDSILKINRRNFNGHVYNLQTTDGWYSANNIITHNCKCEPEPYFYS